MIEVRDKETGAQLGSISEKQLQFLIDELEEEHREDQDYYINRPTIEMFAEHGADEELLQFLRKALGDREEMEIEWTRP
jgi:processive 1,2-diacylglycerol beta-glucosyltransferase